MRFLFLLFLAVTLKLTAVHADFNTEDPNATPDSSSTTQTEARNCFEDPGNVACRKNPGSAVDAEAHFAADTICSRNAIGFGGSSECRENFVKQIGEGGAPAIPGAAVE